MKILMLGSRGPDRVIGGVEAYVRGLSRSLGALGHMVTVSASRIGISSTENTPGRMPLGGRVKVCADGILPSGPWEMPSRAFVGAWRGLCERYDIVHIHGADPALIAAPILELARRRIVVTVHSQNYRSGERFGWVRQYLSLRAERRAFGRANAVVVLTRRMLPDGQETERLWYVPPGTEFSERAIETGPRRGFVVVSRIVPGKGLEALADACREVSIPDAVSVVGGGDASYVRKLVRRSAGKLRFIGPLFGDELAKRIAGASALIMSSVVECAPLVLREALCLGTPVIGHPMFLTELGKSNMLLPCHDIGGSDLVDAMSKARAAPLDLPFVEKVRAQCSWHAQAVKTEQIYHTVLGNR